MAILHVKEWSDAMAWANSSSWSLKNFCHRIEICTNLHGTELKRVARQVMKKEPFELNLADSEKAEALIHTLESMGARVEVK